MQTHCYIVYWIYSKINLNLNLNLTTARVQYRAQFVLHCLKGSSDTVYLPGEIQSIQWHVAKTANANHACHFLRDIVTQGVALKRRNRTVPPWSVGRPTVHAPGGRPARLPAALSLVHTSNNVEATFDFVAKNGNNVERVLRWNFVLSTKSNVASTLLLLWTGFYRR